MLLGVIATTAELKTQTIINYCQIMIVFEKYSPCIATDKIELDLLSSVLSTVFLQTLSYGRLISTSVWVDENGTRWRTCVRVSAYVYPRISAATGC